MNPRVRLSGAGLGLIIPHPTGVLCVRQTMGVCCCQSELEGAFVPFDAEESWLKLNAHFEGPKYAGSGAMRGIDEEDATFIDAVIREACIGASVVVDRSRLPDSHEAWVYVIVQDEANALFEGFGPYPRHGVLTWPNSD